MHKGLLNFYELCSNRKNKVFPIDYFVDKSPLRFDTKDNKIIKKIKLYKSFNVFQTGYEENNKNPVDKDNKTVRLVLRKGSPAPFCKIYSVVFENREDAKKCLLRFDKIINSNSGLFTEIGFTFRKVLSVWNGAVLMTGVVKIGKNSEMCREGRFVYVYDLRSMNAYMANETEDLD